MNEHQAAEGARYAIAVSRFNGPIAEEMLQGVMEGFAAHQVAHSQVDVVHVPGAFELPVAAEALAASGRYQAIIALGAVIRGDTAHFDYVAGSCAQGLTQVGIRHALPVIFGVLTTDTVEQALQRAERRQDNKGFEMAVAALETAAALAAIERNEVGQP
ncbi:MAG: 6,7-dimethyl-8-ribityllumazine synthase [Wenzhouxiangellaceae bacterium]